MSKSLVSAVKGEKALKTNTPQTTKARPEQVKNNAGGFVFKVSDKDRLERFLILGTDGGTYYVGEQKHAAQNIEFLRKFIGKDLQTFLDVVTDVSVNGRAYRNSPAIFAISLALVEAAEDWKARVREVFSLVVRTSTHLFEAAEYVDNLGGWGRAKRKAFAEWYEEKDADALAYQVVKYRQRNGWTHRDVLRLSHAKPNSSVANFVVGKEPDDEIAIIRGFTSMQSAGTEHDVIAVLGQHKNLPWETIPTQFLKSVAVWKTLFYNGQLNGQALVRNVTRLARIGAFKDLKFAADYAARLTDEEMIRKARLHPINFLNASVVHSDGQINRMDSGYGWYASGGRKKDWETSAVILDALNDGFHTSFKTIEPAGKRTMVAIDISGSMSQSAMGLDLSCAQVSAAVGMTIARSEPAYEIRGFSRQFVPLGITAKSSLSVAMKEVSNRTFGGTDCSLPMNWAAKEKMEIDTFVVITDSETWAGGNHPFQALKSYRQKMGIDARLAVLGVAATGFTIADPSDRGMMDFVGFDANAPRVLADFSAGRI